MLADTAVGGEDEAFENELTLDSNDEVDEDNGKWGRALKEEVGVRMDGWALLPDELAEPGADVATCDDEVP